jgi:hypothetical protein
VDVIDPLDLPAQFRAREEHQERVRLAQRIEVSDLKWIMADKRGRRFVWRLLEQAAPLQDPFNANTTIMSRNVGRQEYGRWLYAQLLVHCPESFMMMGREAQEFTNARNGDGPKSN